MENLAFSDKIGLVKSISMEIMTRPTHRYRKLKDLLTLCRDPVNVDVVLKAVNNLCEVFCEIIPSYRIREYEDEKKEEKEGKKKENRMSKEADELRNQEQFILQSYKEYLQILEVFSNIRTLKLAGKGADKEKSVAIYDKLKEKSVSCYCKLLERHTHFNFRLNIL